MLQLICVLTKMYRPSECLQRRDIFCPVLRKDIGKTTRAKKKSGESTFDFSQRPELSVLSRVMRKIVCRQPKEALLYNGGIAESGLQMPHVHVLPVTPLGACDMAQAGADEHQGGVAIREGTHDPGAPADLAIQAFHDVVRANPRPVLGWESLFKRFCKEV